MDSSSSWQRRVAETLGVIGEVGRLGDTAWLVEAGGRRVVVKAGAGASDEAAGLAWMAAVPGGLAVPEVLVHEAGLLVTAWVEPVPRSALHEERLGEGLATLHAARAPAWGGGSSWIGVCRVDPTTKASGPELYGARLIDLARRCGLEREVAGVVDSLDDIVPWEEPRRTHGDLWWGNVLWAPNSRPIAIDPSHHGGHPEEDLAMLALFGPLPHRLTAAYEAVMPLADGWRDRVAFWQLLPLLVHAVTFGGAYVERSAATARRCATR